MPLDKSLITEALRTVPDPAGGLDLITAGRLRHAAACDGLASIKLTAPAGADRDALDRLARAAHRALAGLCRGVHEPLVALNVEFQTESGGPVYSTTVREGSQSAPQQPAQQPPVTVRSRACDPSRPPRRGPTRSPASSASSPSARARAASASRPSR